ncbi:MAG TPA: hypothetical protein VNM92_12080 [Thermoanaerobaculia bacterium]|nr:hypothetical protein [Thermoanaerobaculia bacterium]
MPVKATSLQKGEWRHGWPELLPDGRNFLYQVLSHSSIERELVLGSLDSPNRSVLLRNVSKAVAVGKNNLVFVRDGTLLMQGFDQAKGVMTGDPRTLGSDVAYFYPTAAADFTASSNGVVVYRTNTSTGRIVIKDRKGNDVRVLDADAATVGSLGLSPDGRKVVVGIKTIATGFIDLWIYDLSRAVRDRFTADPGIEVYPVWAPDGRTIVYSSSEGGTVPHMVRRSISGSPPEELLPRGTFQIPRSFSSDSMTIYYGVSQRAGQNIFRMSMSSRVPEAILSTSFSEQEPEVSFDDRWMANVSWATQQAEIYLTDLKAQNQERIRISDKGGWNPRWRRDGKELFYVADSAGVSRIMSATQRKPGDWNDPVVTELFTVPNDVVGFAVLPDGQSFVISDEVRGEMDKLLHVIANVP